MKVSVDTTKKKKVEEKRTAKSTFKLLLRSLYKNDACVEGRKLPWYLAVICFFLSVIISIIPPVVTSATEKGSYVLSNETYSMDVGFVAFNNFLYENKVDIVIKTEKDENGKILDTTLSMSDESYANWKSASEIKVYNEYTYYYEFRTNDVSGEPGPARFRVFYVKGDKSAAKGITPAYEFFYDNPTFGVKSTTNLPENKDTYIAPASFMVLGTHEIFIAVYRNASTKNSEYVGAPFRGDYLRLASGEGIHLHTLLLGKQSTKEDVEAVKNFSMAEPKWEDPANSGWMNFLNAAYSYTRMNNTLMMFSMLSGINALIILVYGFTLWILTRGKKNPNRSIKVNETMKISCFSALSPAILSLIIGFIIPKFGSFSFILLSSFRLMWLSSKALRPMEQ